MDKFWSKVEKHGTGCWEWKAAICGKGYGMFWFENRMHRSHRVAWILTVGEIPEGMQILHRCDNPSCVNPQHLFIGTNQDNVNDKVNKGRQFFSKGTKNGRAKLTEKHIHQIRGMGGKLLQKDIAKMFGISNQLVSRIIRRKCWRHI